MAIPEAFRSTKESSKSESNYSQKESEYPRGYSFGHVVFGLDLDGYGEGTG